MRLYDYAASGKCYKVRLLLALLGRPYERVAVDIFAGDTLTDEYARLNPARETPVLALDEGTIVTQSNAILWYLGEGTEFLPSAAVVRAHVAQWLLFEQERVMNGIGGARFRKLTGRNPELVRSRYALGLTALEILDDHLERRDSLVGGSCTIADISIFAYAHVAEEAGYSLAEFPAVDAWLARVRALPGFVADLTSYPRTPAPGEGARSTTSDRARG